jgi:hypothetical protein
MKCEMYWGDVPCESENTILVNVKLASGGDKKIYMCPKCHYKYFGKRQRHPTQRPPNLGQVQPIQSMKPLLQAGNANR